MANTIQIKRSTNNTIPNSNISGGTLTNGELGYSYSSDDGSGDEAGAGKLFIGHADGLGGTRAAVIIGGSYFTKLLDHANGTLTASSAPNNSLLVWNSGVSRYELKAFTDLAFDAGLMD